MKKLAYDAIVVGAGPNGLAAAIRLAQEKLSVLLVEAKSTVGGGARSAELTLPGFVHDVCSSIHPLAVASPFMSALPLKKYGLEFVESPAALAHPLNDGTAVLLKRSIQETSENLDGDEKNYPSIVGKFVENWEQMAPEILAPLHVPRHPILLARFGLKAMRSARGFAEKYFAGERARAVFAGCAAHSMISFDKLPSAAIGLVMNLSAHAVSWQFPRGGAQKISDALAQYFVALGGEIVTDYEVKDIEELPPARALLFNLTPHQIARIARRSLPASYIKRLENYRYGAGVFKMDFALSDPIPWSADETRQAATVHLGGSFEEIAHAEEQVWNGKPADKPFVLLAQTSLFDSTRAPDGKHTAWAYCHVPNSSTVDMSERLEKQIERFAPGFRDCILAKNILRPAELEIHNQNYVGGDISGGANILSQLFTRPFAKYDPYRMPAKGFYLCSSSTPPGGGVHGMCGFHAAESALANEFR